MIIILITTTKTIMTDNVDNNTETDENIKKEIENIIKNGIEWFNFITKKQDDYYISMKECEDIFEAASSENMEIMFEEKMEWNDQ